MASIIPDPGPQPAATTVSGTTYLNADFTVAAGDVYYGREFAPLFVGDEVTLTNNGTLWSQTSGPQQWLFTGYQNGLVNNGKVYLRGDGMTMLMPQAGARLLGSEYWTIYNTGSIWVVSDHGGLSGLQCNSVGHFYNSGLIAVQSLEAAAAALTSYNNGYVLNDVGGRILAEGKTSAIVFNNTNWGDERADLPMIVNRGLMEAHVTDPTGTSYGVIISHMGGERDTATIINSGIIRADIAIVGTVGSSSQLSEGPVEHVVNQAGGLIDGIIYLDTGHDVIENAGVISGDVLMGEGNDTYSGAGKVNGVVDMGWDDDRYTGGGFSDRAAGGRGNDTLSGGGRRDLLLGGFGDDTLRGGTDNDGLIGEWGADTIVTSGGDYVEGGLGDDRVKLGDYAFEKVLGGSGVDVLEMAAGTRNFSLTAMLAGGRIAGFEILELKANQKLSLGADDITGFTSGLSSLRIDAVASDQIALIGGWTRGADLTVGSTLYENWTLGGKSVLVAEVATVSAVASAPGYGGLNPVATGVAAPRPGLEAGLDYTRQDSYLNGYDLSNDFVVAADEIFWTDGDAGAFVGWTINNFTNHGQIYSLHDTSNRAFGIYMTNFINVQNTGSIVVETSSTGSIDRSWGISAAYGEVDNSGSVYVHSQYGHATAIDARGTIRNSGKIEAYSDSGSGIGVYGASGSDGTGAQRFFNTGSIIVQGFTSSIIPKVAAVGVAMLGGNGVNDGIIYASLAPGAAAGEKSYGVYFWQIDNWPDGSFINNGTIGADIAVAFDTAWHQGFTLTNNGLLVGDVLFDNYNDTYNNAAGRTDGVVFGLGGVDKLTGGVGADTLDGGKGNDTLVGNAGSDTLMGDMGADKLIGGAGMDLLWGGADIASDTFTYKAISDSTASSNRDVIQQFTSGKDIIDLRAIDANSGSVGDQAFLFSNSGPTAYSVWLVDTGSDIRIEADVNGDTSADMSILVKDIASMTASDFLL